MAKTSAALSTKKIRDMMKGWLSQPQIKLDILSQWANGSDDTDRWREWTDVNQWKRREKSKLKDVEGVEVFRTIVYDEPYDRCSDFLSRKHHYEPCFDPDFAGGHDKDLLAKYAADEGEANRCIMRLFEPDNDFGNNFRMEVYTTPDDDAVIAWRIVVD